MTKKVNVNGKYVCKVDLSCTCSSGNRLYCLSKLRRWELNNLVYGPGGRFFASFAKKGGRAIPPEHFKKRREKIGQIISEIELKM